MKTRSDRGPETGELVRGLFEHLLEPIPFWERALRREEVADLVGIGIYSLGIVTISRRFRGKSFAGRAKAGTAPAEFDRGALRRHVETLEMVAEHAPDVFLLAGFVRGLSARSGEVRPTGGVAKERSYSRWLERRLLPMLAQLPDYVDMKGILGPSPDDAPTAKKSGRPLLPHLGRALLWLGDRIGLSDIRLLDDLRDGRRLLGIKWAPLPEELQDPGLVLREVEAIAIEKGVKLSTLARFDEAGRLRWGKRQLRDLLRREEAVRRDHISIDAPTGGGPGSGHGRTRGQGSKGAGGSFAASMKRLAAMHSAAGGTSLEEVLASCDPAAGRARRGPSKKSWEQRAQAIPTNSVPEPEIGRGRSTPPTPEEGIRETAADVAEINEIRTIVRTHQEAVAREIRSPVGKAVALRFQELECVDARDGAKKALAEELGVKPAAVSYWIPRVQERLRERALTDPRLVEFASA